MQIEFFVFKLEPRGLGWLCYKNTGNLQCVQATQRSLKNKTRKCNEIELKLKTAQLRPPNIIRRFQTNLSGRPWPFLYLFILNFFVDGYQILGRFRTSRAFENAR